MHQQHCQLLCDWQVRWSSSPTLFFFCWCAAVLTATTPLRTVLTRWLLSAFLASCLLVVSSFGCRSNLVNLGPSRLHRSIQIIQTVCRHVLRTGLTVTKLTRRLTDRDGLLNVKCGFLCRASFCREYNLFLLNYYGIIQFQQFYCIDIAGVLLSEASCTKQVTSVCHQLLY